jgi:hypothetical protein
MIGSGWRIYNDDVLFGWLRFPRLSCDRQMGAMRPAMALLWNVDIRPQRECSVVGAAWEAG